MNVKHNPLGLIGRYAPLFAVVTFFAVTAALVPSKPGSGGGESGSLLDATSGGAVDLDGDGVVDLATEGADGTVAAGTGPTRGGATQGGGATGGAGGSSAGTTGSRSGTGGGGGGGGAAPGGDCARRDFLGAGSCRPPAFNGANGGSTYRGVTGDQITVVLYEPNANEQVQSIRGAAGSPTDNDRRAVLAAFEKWFNAHFETYGRHVKFVYFKGSGNSTDAAGVQADAVKIAEELKAFAVLEGAATTEPFFAELHRRGIPVFTTFVQLSEASLAKMAPHVFSILPDRDLLLGHVAEYLCKRVLGRNATAAGDTGYRSLPRKFGIIYQAETDNGPFLEREVKRQCGGTVGKMVSYAADISQAVATATNIVSQMKTEGITTVTCICDTIAPIYFTQQATNQGWFPEWIQNGFMVTDAAGAGRLYDPAQWRNSFGVSSLGYPFPVAQQNGYKVCRAGGGPKESCIKAAAFYFASTFYLMGAIEASGPSLTDRSLATALYSMPPGVPSTVNDYRYSFGRGGPGPYSLVDDVMEIWWSPDRSGPDGKLGTPYYVDGGRRYVLGAWATSDAAPLREDGSPQPPRDPDR